MSLYEIVMTLQAAKGTLEKQAILDSHKDNELLKAYLKAVYDPAISYYQTSVKKVSDATGRCFDFSQYILDAIQYHLAERTITGKQAENWLSALHEGASGESKVLIELLIKRSIGAGVGDTMVLKTFPELWFTVPYQRCSLMDEKIKAKFKNLPRFFVQLKADGAFAYLAKQSGKPVEAITRAGNKYPQWFADHLTQGIELDEFVFVGEMLVFDFDKNTVLSRQVGNGILNSIRQGEIPEGSNKYFLSAWDMLTYKEFTDKKSNRTYEERFRELETIAASNVCLIESNIVYSLEEAYKINNNYLAEGREGSVIKNPAALWKSNTSKDIVKLKVSFEVDLMITGITEGTGKYAGSMGSISVSTSDGELTTDVGTGFDDATRQYFWDNRLTLVASGAIVTIKANDITTEDGRRTYSLFLPVFIEVRDDKRLADTYKHCVRQLEAARS